MAITTSVICNSFKKQLLEGTHNFSSGSGNSFKLALYTNSAVPSNMGGSGSTMDASVTNYATNNEVSGTGYTAKGATLTREDSSSSGTTAFTDFANATFSSSTITARGAVIFNDDASNDASVIVLD